MGGPENESWRVCYTPAARQGISPVSRGLKAAHMRNMTATITNAPSEQPTKTHSLSAIDNLRPGTVLALGTLCAVRTATGWLIAGKRGERPTWDLVRRSGTTSGTVLKQGQ